jgi:SAM-dependent methyltransferase
MPRGGLGGMNGWRDTCPVCGAPATAPFLHRSAVPVHQNLPAPTVAAARGVARGDLAMAACPSCGFVFNRAFDPALLRYGPGYDNTQAGSRRFAAHLDALVRYLVERRGVRGAHIVEVGCGDGGFLRRLVAWPGAGNTGIGYDPAHAGPAEILDGRLRFVRGTYPPPGGGPPVDVVICRHVIEHVADPLALLAAIRAARPARVFFETPCIGWILRNAVLWDFFYEHCSLFTARSLTAAFARAGFAVRAVRRVFAGQYLWLEAVPGQAVPPHGAGRVPVLAQRYGAQEPALRAAWCDRLTRLAAGGPVAVWGAGAKGVTFAALADPEVRLIDCVVDINPAKQGRFVPGTGHAIVAPAALGARKVRHVVLMNPAYRPEVASMLPACGRAALAGWAA